MSAARTENARGRLVELLDHYLSTAWEAAGRDWDADNRAEVEAMVDAVVEIATSEAESEAEDARRRHERTEHGRSDQ